MHGTVMCERPAWTDSSGFSLLLFLPFFFSFFLAKDAFMLFFHISLYIFQCLFLLSFEWNILLEFLWPSSSVYQLLCFLTRSLWFSPLSFSLLIPEHLHQQFASALLQLYTVTHTGGNEQIKRQKREREKEKDSIQVGVNEDDLNGWLLSRSVTVVMWDASGIGGPPLPFWET